MNTAELIVVIIAAVIIVALIAWALARQRLGQRRSQQLKERFGPEYDRVVERADDRRAAEAELAARERRHQSLELRELDPGQRAAFEQRWSDVQRDFVDDPSRAVSRADHLVVEVMAARGYPVDHFDQRADDLSVSYPTVTSRYREARRIARANERGQASTEDLRGAVTSYRSLVHALLRDEDAQEERSHAHQEAHREGEVPRAEEAGQTATTPSRNGQEGAV